MNTFYTVSGKVAPYDFVNNNFKSQQIVKRFYTQNQQKLYCIFVH